PVVGDFARDLRHDGVKVSAQFGALEPQEGKLALAGVGRRVEALLGGAVPDRAVGEVDQRLRRVRQALTALPRPELAESLTHYQWLVLCATCRGIHATEIA